jgi:hypothetical protein
VRRGRGRFGCHGPHTLPVHPAGGVVWLSISATRVRHAVVAVGEIMRMAGMGHRGPGAAAPTDVAKLAACTRRLTGRNLAPAVADKNTCCFSLLPGFSGPPVALPATPLSLKVRHFARAVPCLYRQWNRLVPAAACLYPMPVKTAVAVAAMAAKQSRCLSRGLGPCWPTGAPQRRPFFT